MENKKFGKKKLYLITGAVIALCVIIIAIVLTFKGDSKDKKLETQLNLGNSYMDELDYEAAIAAYEEAIRIEAKSEEAYISLANAYIEQGEYEKAIEVLDEGYAQTEAVAISDKKDEIVLLLEKIEEVERQAEVEAQVTPTPVPTSIPMPVPTEPEVNPYQEKIDQAKQYIEDGEYEEAIAELESAIELDATNELAYKELAQLYESLEDYEEALEVLDKGIENTDSEELVMYREHIQQLLMELQAEADAENDATGFLEELLLNHTFYMPSLQDIFFELYNFEEDGYVYRGACSVDGIEWRTERIEGLPYIIEDNAVIIDGAPYYYREELGILVNEYIFEDPFYGPCVEFHWLVPYDGVLSDEVYGEFYNYYHVLHE